MSRRERAYSDAKCITIREADENTRLRALATLTLFSSASASRPRRRKPHSATTSSSRWASNASLTLESTPISGTCTPQVRTLCDCSRLAAWYRAKPLRSYKQLGELYRAGTQTNDVITRLRVFGMPKPCSPCLRPAAPRSQARLSRRVHLPGARPTPG